MRIRVRGNHLERDGRPFFWLADTVWSAFTNITDEDWLAYLDLRAAQGFNVLQINALPQWDRCGCAFDRYPFATADHGATFDFSKINDAYFKHARWQLKEAVRRGFTPALVVMWSNYVPGTWAAKLSPQTVISERWVESIVSKVCGSFNEFDPVYIISGDTDFDAPETVDRYRRVTELVERLAPGALLAYHIKGRFDGLPEELAHHADLYLYQSGHNTTAQDGAYKLAASFLARPERRPVINSEPCYEQMGYSHMLYGRWERRDTRRALWWSLLGGASAGITYGAHGVWNWQDPTAGHNAEGEGFLQALQHDEALALPGAWDYAFARSLMERLGLLELVSRQDLLASEHRAGVRVAITASGEIMLVYLPTNASVRIRGNVAGCSGCVRGFDLARREPLCLAAHYDANSNVTLVEQGSYGADALLVVERS